MQILMQPGMVYEYPLWWVGLLLAGASVFERHFVEYANSAAS